MSLGAATNTFPRVNTPNYVAHSRSAIPVSASNDVTLRRTIPFDYAFRFDLKGEPGNTHNQSLSVSIEASFTAVSIGYGVVPTTSPLKFGLLPQTLANGLDAAPKQVGSIFFKSLATSFVATPPPEDTASTAAHSTTLAAHRLGLRVPTVNIPIDNLRLRLGGLQKNVKADYGPDIEHLQQTTTRTAIREFAQKALLRMLIAALAEALNENLDPNKPVLGPRTAEALRNGIKFNPEFIERMLLSLDGNELDDRSFLEAFQVVTAPLDRIQFKYALFDGGSGREFQSEPILSTAGLGSPDGRRPFRYFARPIEFSPRSSIRLQVTEVSDFVGELHVSLQGYKTLGGAGTPTAVNRLKRRERGS